MTVQGGIDRPTSKGRVWRLSVGKKPKKGDIGAKVVSGERRKKKPSHSDKTYTVAGEEDTML